MSHTEDLSDDERLDAVVCVFWRELPGGDLTILVGFHMKPAAEQLLGTKWAAVEVGFVAYAGGPTDPHPAPIYMPKHRAAAFLEVLNFSDGQGWKMHETTRRQLTSKAWAWAETEDDGAHPFRPEGDRRNRRLN